MMVLVSTLVVLVQQQVLVVILYALGATQFAEIETVVAPKGNHQRFIKCDCRCTYQGLCVVQLLGNDDLKLCTLCDASNGVAKWAMGN